MKVENAVALVTGANRGIGLDHRPDRAGIDQVRDFAQLACAGLHEEEREGDAVALRLAADA